MESPRENLNISSLPLEARSQLLDFYDFLFEKYAAPRKIDTTERKPRFTKFLARPIKVKEIISYSREAVHARK